MKVVVTNPDGTLAAVSWADDEDTVIGSLEFALDEMRKMEDGT